MKKNLEKIFASASIVVAIVLIMVLIITAFGGISTDEFDSQLVRGLLITLAILYFILAGVALALMFIVGDAVKEIVIHTEQKGSMRVSVGVVNKMVKQTCKEVDGVKCKKVALISDEYGVRLKLSVKIIDKEVVETETYLRTLLEDVFMGEFGFRFHTIEIKITSLQPKYKADQAVIDERVKEKLAQIKEQQDAQLAAQEAQAEAATSVETEYDSVVVDEGAQDAETAVADIVEDEEVVSETEEDTAVAEDEIDK